MYQINFEKKIPTDILHLYKIISSEIHVRQNSNESM